MQQPLPQPTQQQMQQQMQYMQHQTQPMQMSMQEMSQQMAGQSGGSRTSPSWTFHHSRREPGLPESEGQAAMLNQAGLLSMSSISPQTSALPPQEPADALGTSGTDTPGSEDS